MEPFEAATRKLACDSLPTLSIVIPVITTLITSLEDRTTDCSFMKKIKDTLRFSIEERFKDLYQTKLVWREFKEKAFINEVLLDINMYSIRSKMERFFLPPTFILSESC